MGFDSLASGADMQISLHIHSMIYFLFVIKNIYFYFIKSCLVVGSTPESPFQILPDKESNLGTVGFPVGRLLHAWRSFLHD